MENRVKFLSFWAIDSLEDVFVIEKQMDDFVKLGFNGVVFHPRYYNGKIPYLSDEYMRILSDIILYAKKIGLEFWLYDENGWPSGSAGGKVEENYPEVKCQWLEYENGTVIKAEKMGINPLDKKGVELFIELTHNAYAQRLDSEAFEYVKGFFSDEVGFCDEDDCIPWCDEIAERYNIEFSGDINCKLKTLFDAEKSVFKGWYWETLADILAKNFYNTIEKWCNKHNKLYTAHLKGEENILFQIPYSGSALQVLKNISVPGVDALERFKGNEYYPRIASSLARQFGRGIAMAEAMGGAGWGLNPDNVYDYAKWLISCGTNMFVFHINQLHLNYSGITDWPASIPMHQPWREAFPNILSRIEKAAQCIQMPDTLLICPDRGIMEGFSPYLAEGMNVHDGSNQKITHEQKISHECISFAERLSKEGINFDITDEKIFEEYAVPFENGVKIGNATYKTIIALDGCSFSEKISENVLNVSEIEIKNGKIQKSRVVQEEWTITPPPENRYIIEVSNGKGYINLEYVSDFTLLVSDYTENIFVNGEKLKHFKNDEHGYYYRLPKELLHIGKNCFETEKDVFAFVIGDFQVKNKADFFEFDSHQVFTENQFYITEKADIGRDFILSGYPFCDKPLKCTKKLLGKGKIYISFDCSHCAMAKVYIDGKETSFLYKGNNETAIELTGENELTFEVYQSAFNIYGPHYHMEGDRHLTSPQQFEYIKNFADSLSLPECTKDDKMKLLKWEIPKNISIIGG